MNRKRYWLVGAFAAILLLPSAVRAGSSAKGPAALNGQKAPAFSTSDIYGKTLGLEALLGRYEGVVLNFWGLRCSACLEEIPALNGIQAKYRDRIAVLGVNVDAIDGDMLRKMLENGGPKISYVVVPDPDFRIIDLYRMVAAPLTIVVDRDGVIRYVHEDYKPGDEKELDAVLAGLPAPGK